MDEMLESLSEFCLSNRHLFDTEERFYGEPGVPPVCSAWNKGMIDWEKRAIRKEKQKEYWNPNTKDKGKVARMADMTPEERLAHKRKQWAEASRRYRRRQHVK